MAKQKSDHASTPALPTNSGGGSLPSLPARKVKGRTVNTCEPSSKTKRLTRQLAGIMAHLEQHPGDALSRQRVATINELLRR